MLNKLLYTYIKMIDFLNKDGNTANVSTPIGGPTTFDFTAVNPTLLVIEVDGKSNNLQTVTFDSSTDTRLVFFNYYIYSCYCY